MLFKKCLTRFKKERKIESAFNFKKMDIHCQFSAPLKADGVPPNLNSQEWEFSKMDCSTTATTTTSTLPEYITKITSTSTPERYFYISKTIDLGEVLVIGFIALLVTFAIIIGIKNLLRKTKVEF